MSGVFALILVLMCSEKSQSKQVQTSEVSPRPNVLVITTDDLDLATYEAVPELQAMLDEQGVVFENSFVTNPLCCPSRATFLRGQYAHNTGVMTNIPPYGGYGRYSELGRERNDLPVWLGREGYRTGFFGKYMNGYGNSAVPPGWDRFHVTAHGERYRNDSGWHKYEPGEWRDDVSTAAAARFIGRQERAGKPFFAWVSLLSPHAEANRVDYDAPRRYRGSGARAASLPEKASRDYDLRGKPEWVMENRSFARSNPPDLEGDFRDRVNMMRGTADNLRRLLTVLEKSGHAEDTYVIFTSDNGYMMGEHYIRPSKLAPYDESIRVPLVMRGPGIAKGETVESIATNNDLAPTITHLTRSKTPAFVDGRSLKRMIDGRTVRKRTLVEHLATRESQFGNPVPTTYRMVRDERYAYVEYESGERELYDTTEDPLQMRNIVESEPQRAAELSTHLQKLAGCRAEGCRAAENAP